MEKKITTIGTLAASRRQKWQYPTAQQTPRILHLPRRPRRKSAPATTKAAEANRKVKLETLFDKERAFSNGLKERRERVEETRESGAVEAEKWRFQAEMLRAECNLLRMEREIAVKKMERRRIQVERALKSAVQILISGRKRICEGKIAGNLLEEEIMELVEELEKLQIRSKNKGFEVRNCSNFDKQASLLQTRIEKFAGEANEICVKEIQEMAEASLSITTTGNNVEILRRKMDGLSSENLLETMKMDEKNKCKYRTCCWCCKAIMQRVVDQIRAETEQWSQMQEILGRVRDEMEELQASRAFWEDRALSSGHEVESLNRVANQWRQRALASEAKVEELQANVSVLEIETKRLRKEREDRAKNLVPNSLESTNETEKRVLVCRLKENRHEGRKTNVSASRGHSGLNRTPFREIGNSSPLLRQNNNNNSRAVFPLCYALSMNENRV